jgi:glycerol-3-phosphate dehydrogenase
MKRDLGALGARRFDVLVVGGGIYGAACAWDAAQRGLTVALVEAGDFASGTTWNSLKTIHGGLRYLQALDVRRMRASIRERRTLLRLAPELVRPLPFVVPTYGHGLHGLEALFLGLLVNDFVAHDRNRGLPASQHLPPGRMLTRRELFDLFPELPRVRISGGALWYDAQVSSEARLVLAYLHAATEAGALAINYCEALEILRDEAGQVRGARVRDVEGGQVFDVRAAALLNCTGPGLSTLIERASLPTPGVKLLRAFNLVLERPGLGAHALGMRSGGRYLFAVP